MKVDELMIGDWVEYNGEFYRVSSIDVLMDSIGMTTDDLSHIVVPSRYIRLIPLTEEILGKNSFELFSTIPYTSYVYYLMNTNESSIFIILPHNNRNLEVAFNFYINDDDKCISDLPISYVHELQHALRLCKIDKKIVV